MACNKIRISCEENNTLYYYYEADNHEWIIIDYYDSPLSRNDSINIDIMGNAEQILKRIDDDYNYENEGVEIFFNGDEDVYEVLCNTIRASFPESNLTCEIEVLPCYEEKEESDEEPILEPEEPVLSELEDIIITKRDEIEKNEKRSYSYKNIHIVGNIACNGDLSFDHCNIYYNESEAGSQIFIYSLPYTNLYITNSTVVCRGLKKEDEFSLFEGGLYNLIIQSTKFEDCSFFYNGNVDGQFELSNCDFMNCCADVINVSGVSNESKCEIKNNVVKFKELASFYKDLKYEHLFNKNEFISVLGYDNYGANIVNTTFEEDRGFYEYFKTNSFWGNLDGIYSIYCITGTLESITLKNCTFVGLTNSIGANRVQSCVFKDCLEGVWTTSPSSRYDTRTYIRDCTFENCGTAIVAADNRMEISNCQFISCEKDIKYTVVY